MSMNTCYSYFDSYGVFYSSFKCSFYCCGTCTRKYCCSSYFYKLDQSKCENAPSINNDSTNNLILFVLIFIPIVAAICCIVFCASKKLSNQANLNRVGSNENGSNDSNRNTESSDFNTIFHNNLEMKKTNIEPPPTYESLFSGRSNESRDQDRIQISHI